MELHRFLTLVYICSLDLFRVIFQNGVYLQSWEDGAAHPVHGEQRLLVNYLLHLLDYALRFTFFSFEISPLLVLSVDLRAEIEVGLYYKFLCLPTGPKDCGHSFLPWHVISMVLISRKNALWMYFPGNNLNFSLEVTFRFSMNHWWVKEFCKFATYLMKTDCFSVSYPRFEGNKNLNITFFSSHSYRQRDSNLFKSSGSLPIWITVISLLLTVCSSLNGRVQI